jgi:hypothetical protein
MQIMIPGSQNEAPQHGTGNIKSILVINIFPRLELFNLIILYS